MEEVLKLADEDFSGLCFVNLVDFDSLWGHRRDTKGYALGLNEFDALLGRLLPKLDDNDALIITADHGCDPSDNSTDHTRECVPVLIYQKGRKAENLGTMEGFFRVGELVMSALT
jgi:phosphopentomutase